MGNIVYNIHEPSIVQDIYTSKNKYVDKLGESEQIFSDLLGKSFLFSKGDDVWKAKRKATSHAFYKDKLIPMLDILKEQIMKRFHIWLKQIEDSPDGTARINMAREFSEIFSRNIITIALGEDISDQTIDMNIENADGSFSK